MVHITLLVHKQQVLLAITSNSHYKNQFFESQPTADFQKTDLVFLAPKALEIPSQFHKGLTKN
jgi:hypothetical protein